MPNRVVKETKLIPRGKQSAADGIGTISGLGGRQWGADSIEGVAFFIVHSIAQPTADNGIDLNLSVQLQHSIDGENWVNLGSAMAWEPSGIPTVADLPHTVAVAVTQYSKYIRAAWTFTDADTSPSGFTVDFEVLFGGKT